MDKKKVMYIWQKRIYFIIYTLVMMIISKIGLDTNYLKMLSAIIVAVFMAVPYLKGKYLTKQKAILPQEMPEGGNANA